MQYASEDPVHESSTTKQQQARSHAELDARSRATRTAPTSAGATTATGSSGHKSSPIDTTTSPSSRRSTKTNSKSNNRLSNPEQPRSTRELLSRLFRSSSSATDKSARYRGDSNSNSSSSDSERLLRTNNAAHSPILTSNMAALQLHGRKSSPATDEDDTSDLDSNVDYAEHQQHQQHQQAQQAAHDDLRRRESAPAQMKTHDAAHAQSKSSNSRTGTHQVLAQGYLTKLPARKYGLAKTDPLRVTLQQFRKLDDAIANRRDLVLSELALSEDDVIVDMSNQLGKPGFELLLAAARADGEGTSSAAGSDSASIWAAMAALATSSQQQQQQHNDPQRLAPSPESLRLLAPDALALEHWISVIGTAIARLIFQSTRSSNSNTTTSRFTGPAKITPIVSDNNSDSGSSSSDSDSGPNDRIAQREELRPPEQQTRKYDNDEEEKPRHPLVEKRDANDRARSYAHSGGGGSDVSTDGGDNNDTYDDVDNQEDDDDDAFTAPSDLDAHFVATQQWPRDRFMSPQSPPPSLSSSLSSVSGSSSSSSSSSLLESPSFTPTGSPSHHDDNALSPDLSATELRTLMSQQSDDSDNSNNANRSTAFSHFIVSPNPPAQLVRKTSTATATATSAPTSSTNSNDKRDGPTTDELKTAPPANALARASSSATAFLRARFGRSGSASASPSSSSAPFYVRPPLPPPTHTFTANGQVFTLDVRYALLKSIGTGAYGAVIAVHDAVNDVDVAVKKITNIFEDLVDAKRILREVRLLHHFDHKNITRLVDLAPPLSRLQFDDMYIITELMETDLHQVIYSMQPMSDDHVKYFLYQMLCALHHIHAAGVIHRDMKPSNVLLNSNCDLKICDFGLARGGVPATAARATGGSLASPGGRNSSSETDTEPRNNPHDDELTEYVVTRWYRAPEIMLNCLQYTEAIDVWAVGCIFAEMLLREPLFPGNDYIHQLKLIIKFLGTPKQEDTAFVKNAKALRFLTKLPISKPRKWSDVFAAAGLESDSIGSGNETSDVNPLAVDLLQQMLRFNPAKRISVAAALQHPYLATFFDPADIVDARPFDFTFDLPDDALTKDALIALLCEDIEAFHPQSTMVSNRHSTNNNSSHAQALAHAGRYFPTGTTAQAS